MSGSSTPKKKAEEQPDPLATPGPAQTLTQGMDDLRAAAAEAVPAEPTKKKGKDD